MLLNIPLLLALENQKKTFHPNARQFDVNIDVNTYNSGKYLMYQHGNYRCIYRRSQVAKIAPLCRHLGTLRGKHSASAAIFLKFLIVTRIL